MSNEPMVLETLKLKACEAFFFVKTAIGYDII